jgi:hypothetical protein
MVRKKPLSDADVALVQGLLEEVQPHQVFAAGDLSGECWAVAGMTQGDCVCAHA